jgi:aminoglycoside 3-N-acetyltransferase
VIPSFSIPQLKRALGDVGIGTGAIVVVHSSILHLGRLSDASTSDVAARIVDAVLDVIGDTGTIAVPASNWEYGDRGVPFDIRRSPAAADLGILSNNVLARSGVARSPNPTFSLALLGAQAEWVCSGGNAHAFGYDSAWDRLFQADAEIVLLGCPLERMSFVRYIEMRFGVPYLYNKLFTAPVLDDGRPTGQTVVSLLRYRAIPLRYNLGRLGDALRGQRLLREAPLGGGRVAVVRMGDCFTTATDCLKHDLHFLLAAPPQYIQDELPLR